MCVLYVLVCVYVYVSVSVRVCVSVCVHARVGDSSLLLEHVMVSLQVYVRVWCCHFSLSVYFQLCVQNRLTQKIKILCV